MTETIQEKILHSDFFALAEEVRNQAPEESYNVEFLGEIDESYKGFRKGTLNLIAGKSGVGKSAMCVNVALDLFLKGFKVGFISTELTKERITERFVARSTMTELNVVEAKSKSEVFDFVAKLQEHTTGSLNIVEENSITDMATVVDVMYQNGCEVIIIDHLHAISDDSSSDALNVWLTTFLPYWRDKKITFIGAVQFKKGGQLTKDDSGQKSMEDISGTSKVAYLASEIIHIYESDAQRDSNEQQRDYNKTHNANFPFKITLKLLKSRHGGSTGARYLFEYRPAYQELTFNSKYDYKSKN